MATFVLATWSSNQRTDDQVASNVHLYFKQPSGDEEYQELFGELCKTLSRDGGT